MREPDDLTRAREALAAAAATSDPAVRACYLAVARNAHGRAAADVEALRILLDAREAELARVPA